MACSTTDLTAVLSATRFSHHLDAVLSVMGQTTEVSKVYCVWFNYPEQSSAIILSLMRAEQNNLLAYLT